MKTFDAKEDRLGVRYPVSVDTSGLSERDVNILRMIAEFGGKTFIEVLEDTFWYGKKLASQQARDRVQKLKKKYKLLRHVPTGLVKPRNAIALTEFAKRYAEDELGIETASLFLSPVTIWHSIYEQIAWYWLCLGGREASRTIVKRWSLEHKHTPDLLYFHEGDTAKPVYVEIELHPKSPSRYIDIMRRIHADKVHAVLYVFENENKMRKIGRKLPVDDSLYFVSIDRLIQSVSTTGKIGAIKQIDFMKKYEGV